VAIETPSGVWNLLAIAPSAMSTAAEASPPPPISIAKLGVPKTTSLVYETIFKVRNSRDPKIGGPLPFYKQSWEENIIETIVLILSSCWPLGQGQVDEATLIQLRKISDFRNEVVVASERLFAAAAINGVQKYLPSLFGLVRLR
jgi:hypothetical protein